MRISTGTIDEVGPWDDNVSVKDSHQTAIRLEPELYELLKEHLADQNYTMNRLIRMLLWKHIDECTK